MRRALTRTVAAFSYNRNSDTGRIIREITSCTFASPCFLEREGEAGRKPSKLSSLSANASAFPSSALDVDIVRDTERRKSFRELVMAHSCPRTISNQRAMRKLTSWPALCMDRLEIGRKDDRDSVLLMITRIYFRGKANYRL